MKRNAKKNLIPFYIVTGFLGAGKTTFIQKILQNSKDQYIKIFVNEFADQGVDQEILRQEREIDISLLKDGCLCCDKNTFFLDLLEKQYKMWQSEEKMPDFVLLESSGFFMPGPLLKSFFSNSFFLSSFRYAGLITLIDVFHGIQNLSKFLEAQKQIQFADIVLFTKTEKAPERIVESLKKKAQLYNKEAPFYFAKDFFQHYPDLSLLFENIICQKDCFREDSHPQSVKSFVFPIFENEAENLTITMIERFFAYLQEKFGDKILRMKALIKRKDFNKFWLFQSTQGIFYPYETLMIREGIKNSSYFVVIAKEKDIENIEKIFNAFFQRPKIDEADFDALVNNPLEILNFTFKVK